MTTQMMDSSCNTSSTLWEYLETYNHEKPDDLAFINLGADNVEEEVLTYAELHNMATFYGLRLRDCTQPGDRAILMFPTSLAFVVAFFACHYAGVVPVPMVPLKGKRMRRTVLAIADNCKASVVITPVQKSELMKKQLSSLSCYENTTYMEVDLLIEPSDGVANAHRALSGELAFIQYTSGSTSVPKGVMVSHSNLAANLEMMAAGFENDPESSYVGWAPLYHDMGLIANVLEPFYLGTLCVLMAPNLFAHRPWLWLKAISDYRAHVSGGPNNAYDLCLDRADEILKMGLDLSSWRIAFNSAEPVRAETLRRFTQTFSSIGFRAETFYPCFGMAEATLLITGGTRAQQPIIKTVSRKGLATGRANSPLEGNDSCQIVACGSVLENESLKIVEPRSFEAQQDGTVGEIWVSGPHIPTGYWDNSVASEEIFHAKVANGDGTRYLRTSDLGFVFDGELYVTGRLSDLIIVRGHNIYPQDLEYIAERAAPELKRNSGAAFSIEDPHSGEQTLVLVQEVKMAHRYSIDMSAAIRAIRQTILAETEITIHEIVLVGPGSIPKTSSGKIRRAETRSRYLDNILSRVVPRTAGKDSLLTAG